MIHFSSSKTPLCFLVQQKKSFLLLHKYLKSKDLKKESTELILAKFGTSNNLSVRLVIKILFVNLDLAQN